MAIHRDFSLILLAIENQQRFQAENRQKKDFLRDFFSFKTKLFVSFAKKNLFLSIRAQVCVSAR